MTSFYSTPGPAGTIQIGEVTKGAPQSEPVVTNSGTPEAAVLNFSIPQGESGIVSAAGDGTAAAPGIAFASETGLGVYRPGAGQLALSTNGTGRLFVDASGNVGIGGAANTSLEITNAAPAIRLSDTNGPTDNNKYQIWINASQELVIQGFTDAGSGGGSTWRFTRNAANIENLIGTRAGADRITLSNWDNRIAFSNALGVLGTSTTHDLQILTNNTERARIDSSGRLLVGTSSDSGGALLQVNGNRIRVATAKTPASASDTGTTGEICWDASYIYVCTATNTWKRTALSTW